MKLLRKFLLRIIPPMVLIIVLLLGLSTNSSFKLLDKLNKDYFSNVASSVENSLRIYFEANVSITNIYTKNERYIEFLENYEAGTLTPELQDEINRSLSEFANSMPGIFVADIINLNGDVIASNNTMLINNFNIGFLENVKDAISNPNKVAIDSYDPIIGTDSSIRDNALFDFSKAIISKKTGKPLGIFIWAVYASIFNDKYIAGVKPFQNGFIFLTSEKEEIIYHPDQSLKQFSSDMTSNSVWRSKQTGFFSFSDASKLPSLAYITYDSQTKIVIGIKAFEKDVYKEIMDMIKQSSTVSLTLIAVLTWFIYYILKIMIFSIVDIISYVKFMSEGDFSRWIDDKYVKQKDELGQLTWAIITMKAELTKFVVNVTKTSENLNNSAIQVQNSSRNISHEAASEAASVEEISSSIEEMANNISKSSQNAKETESIAKETAVAIKKGGDAVNETVLAMREISNKVATIQQISSNTNLIALNASIEASRAGQAGKGFSVVAVEVRKLAEKSALVSHEIFELSSKSLTVSENAGNLLNEAIPKVQKTALLVEDIALVSSEQNSSISQIKNAILSLNTSIQSNTSASEELSSMSEEVSDSSNTLNESLHWFKIDAKLLEKFDN